VGLLLALVSACGAGEPAAKAAPTPSTFIVTGSITARADASISVDTETTALHDGDLGCTTKDGYDDISIGAQVNVRSSTGEVLAVGSLAEGVCRQDPEYAILGDCEFTFAVPNVPSDSDLYLIEVSHRGELTYTREKLNDPIKLTLG
jgi:hypothetical protein